MASATIPEHRAGEFASREAMEQAHESWEAANLVVNYDVEMLSSDADDEPSTDDEARRKQKATDKVAAREARRAAAKERAERSDKAVAKPHLKVKSVVVKDVADSSDATAPAADGAAAGAAASSSV